MITAAVAPQFIPNRVLCGGTAPRRSRRSLRIALAAACFAVWSVMFPAARAEAGSLVIPAWSFARGNARVHASPHPYADAGPVVGSGPEQPWGWAVEYDIDFPVTGNYTLQVCYAAAEARPMEIFFNGKMLVDKCCIGVTFGPASLDKPAEVTWNSSGANWEGLYNQGSLQVPHQLAITKGMHTLKLARGGPLPHLVALRLNTPAAFPEDWKPPQYQVRDLDSIPAASRTAFLAPGGVSDAALPPYIKDITATPVAGSLVIPAWTFDRGNARIFASPEQYADDGPVVGSNPLTPGGGVVEYDIDFPVSAEYTLQISYAAAEARPVEVLLDGRNLGKSCYGVTFGSSRTELPVRFSWSSRSAQWEERPLKLSVAEGRHTLKLARSGPLPHLVALRLDSPTAFPKDWKQPSRKVRNLDGVPAPQRAAFLTPGAVNVAAMRLAIQDTMTEFGPGYPDGEQHLKQLTELEAQQNAAEGGAAGDQQKIEEALAVLRRRAMLTHPALKFDKLLFLKRSADLYGHTYHDQDSNTMGGNLCILSPVTPDGKVTTLVPELDGGLFGQFDLSFDAMKVVFAYKKKDGPFRIHEIDLDPSTGLMVPGSLRQLTFGTDEEAKAFRCNIVNNGITRFHDIDPCYLPNGKIMFASTRATRIVFCAPGATVTTLHLMDADGRNLHRISESPVNETAPSVMDDGRVLYTRWEYVDKGLGNGEGLWSVRPDGSGVDHVYKNNTVWPAAMSSARSIPGSQKIVTIAGGHHTAAVGSVVVVDSTRSRSATEAMTSLTPETGYPPSMSFPTTKFGTYMDPYPMSEKFFLVSHNPGAKHGNEIVYGIYALDAWGNRAEIYRDPDISCFQPIPLRPRCRPTEIAPVVLAEDAKENGQASLFIQDIYQGMTGIERGRVKYVRVMGALPWLWNEDGISWSLGTDPHRKMTYGVVKVHADGSVYFSVPANENLFFQALDEDFMALQQMPTFINLMPGEQRSCIGCHEPRGNAPGTTSVRALALDQPAQTLAPQPGDTGPRTVDFAADVQPALDKHCIGCHGGEEPKGHLDLAGVPTEKYSRSYDNFIGKGLISYRDCAYGAAHFQAVPPLTHGSHRSKLTAQMLQDPCKADLTREEFIKIVTWIDANVPYYGTYRGMRSLADKDDPNFRALPLVGK
ncbi:MAG: hypothetical protein NTW21_05330 [Verrucomicrobia bacterium]|nr:hypothetical protein [Verrucomicrobiota bacterium]